MAIMFTPAQMLVLEAQQLRAFAAEVARTLTPIVGKHRAMPGPEATERFACEQLERARMRGLKRKNEMMAWSLCAFVHGADFEQRIEQVGEILAERNYDRSMLLTLLALHGLRDAKQGA